MCHLAIEKTLKGVYYEKRREFPLKSHNLIYLLNEMGIMPPEEHGRFMVKLSEAGVTTRCPQDLASVQRVYHDAVVKDILVRGKEVITWIRGQL
jgi:HEPN domain-containing protein